MIIYNFFSSTFKFFFFNFLATPLSTWDLSSPTRDQIQVPMHWKQGVLNTGASWKSLNLGLLRPISRRDLPYYFFDFFLTNKNVCQPIQKKKVRIFSIFRMRQLSRKSIHLRHTKNEEAGGKEDSPQNADLLAMTVMNSKWDKKLMWKCSER